MKQAQNCFPPVFCPVVHTFENFVCNLKEDQLQDRERDGRIFKLKVEKQDVKIRIGFNWHATGELRFKLKLEYANRYFDVHVPRVCHNHA